MARGELLSELLMLVLERGEGAAARILRQIQLRQCFVLPQGLFSASQRCRDAEMVFLSGV